ncbi:chromosome segregation protein SMC [Congregibacter variabilis]|uniref:Chromosome partition protein Smc n=1 Tax=Congregibacter variabilis TaxID=3081200 RepID=A0ABZ0I596_9GAMM|nr:chromosome segregation protein SMC [Congregibacter sp. IMCC43200]
MRLKSIKLAGFKSFVDPTAVHFPTNMSAVVGPNGCGKSNIIDAVRWVMGESSAKNLRGESMADVIFNGSGNRQPVGQASIELVFDNSDGGVGGEYASYAEIGIRRQVTRDGQSEYFLNGTKCRRRDITDIFLGTGLGPRSYAIIEQGMISRLIESKPEELRIFIEEAAGISKYKERRRETESRMRRTLENLERLTDLRDELERQLQHLQRQSQAAEKYKNLKAEERALRQQLMAAQLRELQSKLAAAAHEVGEHEVRLESVYADQQRVDTSLEQHRVTHSERNDELVEVQGRFYAIGSEVSRIEQEIRYQGEKAQQINDDLRSTEVGLAQANQHLEEDGDRLSGWEEELASLGPALESQRAAAASASAALADAETKMQSWQTDWDEFNQKAAVPRQQTEVQQSRIQHLEHSLARLQKRLEQLGHERESQNDDEAMEALASLREELELANDASEVLSEKLQSLEGDVTRLRLERRERQEKLNDMRSKLQIQRGREASLDALQQAAKERAEGGKVGDWLRQRGLSQNPRLLDELQVEARWQSAVEVVLGGALQGVCVDSVDTLDEALGELASGDLTLFETGAEGSHAEDSLARKLQGESPAQSLLAAVRCAENSADARAKRSSLAPGESLITPEGLWFGRNWLRTLNGGETESGLIGRQQELEALGQEIAQLTDAEAEAKNALADSDERLATAEQQLKASRAEADSAAVKRSDVLSQVRAEEAKQEQVLARRERLDHEVKELRSQFEQEQSAIGEARSKLAAAIESMDGDTADREARLSLRDGLRSALDSARSQAHQSRDSAHQAALRHQSLVTQSETIRSALVRSREQVERLGERLEILQSSRLENDEPLEGLKLDLESQLALRLESETHLTAARQALADIEHTLREAEQERIQIEQRAAGLREKLESRRFAVQGLEHQQNTMQGQLEELGGNLDSLLEALPEEVDMSAWQAELERYANRIARLGPINLAAVEEYQQQSERKRYLDAQNEDLESALDTLEAAIRKIDKETRNRFKDTFDQVNAGLQELFPRVFGGGAASLEMTGDDLLDTGVSILAQPPGKKNSTIHLLSGGEKALTAIALVFSIFQLNPAPFCMLDEVDAPLDDANVGRYARMVKEMSEKVQFVFITHNKITMEMADQLMGVTMHEPGVSRLVTVDVEEAAELAAS